ncbi:transposase [Streptomyces sp. NPDC087894]|uniref:transposase n=1 Tax=Streptomyces sp. NPDC087894 TaxID=3365816 RepID=UPI00382D7B67
MHAHGPLPDDSNLGRALAVLARAQQKWLWNRQQLPNHPIEGRSRRSRRPRRCCCRGCPSAPATLRSPSALVPGVRLGARVLIEIADDRTRYAEARDLMAHAGATPIARASGRKTNITRRQSRTTAPPRSLSSGFLLHHHLAQHQSPPPATPQRPRRLARRRTTQPLQP